jgi:uncharacterized protein
MTNNLNHPFFYVKSPISQLFASLMVVLITGILLFAIFLLLGKLIFNTDLGVLENLSPETGWKEVAFIKYTLVVQDISFFIIPAVIILTKLNPGYQVGIMNLKTLRINDVILVIILSLCAFPVTSFAGQINSGMEFPDWLSNIEQWMKNKEEYADHLLDLIMTPETFMGMWLNLLIIAALPAVGEELIFRGVLQKILHNLLRSGHFSVWITSFLFSAIHFQFYGFLPRFILGMIFGYLFLWTRNLWFPVIAHFINNALPTVGAYLKGWEKINESTYVSPGGQILGMIVSLTIGVIILTYFRMRSYEDPEGKGDTSQVKST